MEQAVVDLEDQITVEETPLLVMVVVDRYLSTRNDTSNKQKL